MKKKVAEKIKQSRSVVITSHVRPDADSIGSGLALFQMLRQLGKEVRYRLTDHAPHPINRLPGYEKIEFRQIYPDPFDLLIFIEGGTEDRTGHKHVDRYDSINIDHHASSHRDARLNWVIPEAAAVGEMVFELGEELGVTFSRDIAFNLYAAIVSDTGSFKYSNTSARCLQVSSSLVERGGFAPVEVSNLLFNSNPPEKIAMMSKVLATLELAMDKRVAMIRFQRDFLPHLALRDIETEDIIACARSIQDVQVILFFKEMDAEYFRVSIRSRGDFSAQKVAQQFGGDGHHHAAGFYFSGTIANAKAEILKLVGQQLL